MLQSKDTEQLKTRPNYMLPTRNSLQLQGHTNKRIKKKKDIPCKWKPLDDSTRKLLLLLIQ